MPGPNSIRSTTVTNWNCSTYDRTLLNAHILFSRRPTGVIDGVRIRLQVHAVPILVRGEILSEEPDPSGGVVLDGIHRARTHGPVGRLQQTLCILSGR